MPKQSDRHPFRQYMPPAEVQAMRTAPPNGLTWYVRINAAPPVNGECDMRIRP